MWSLSGLHSMGVASNASFVVGNYKSANKQNYLQKTGGTVGEGDFHNRKKGAPTLVFGRPFSGPAGRIGEKDERAKKSKRARLSGAVRRNARGPGEDLGGVRIPHTFCFGTHREELDLRPARPSSPFGWAADLIASRSPQGRVPGLSCIMTFGLVSSDVCFSIINSFLSLVDVFR